MKLSFLLLISLLISGSALASLGGDGPIDNINEAKIVIGSLTELDELSFLFEGRSGLALKAKCEKKLIAGEECKILAKIPDDSDD